MEKVITPSIVRCPGTMQTKISTLNDLGCGRVHVDISICEDITSLFTLEQFTPTKRKQLMTMIDLHLFSRTGNIDSRVLQMITKHDRLFIHVFPTTTRWQIEDMLQVYEKADVKTGLVLDLYADPSLITPFLNRVGVVMVMGIAAGGSLAPLDHGASKRITMVQRAQGSIKKPLNIGIDGGVNTQTFSDFCHMANTIVIGSLLFSASDLLVQWSSLNLCLQET